MLYLAVFPTSLFLGAVYGEGLFLALAAGTFALAERGRLGGPQAAEEAVDPERARAAAEGVGVHLRGGHGPRIARAEILRPEGPSVMEGPS